MTDAEFERRKMWDESLMTEEEKKARIERILSHCGKIDDPTFRRYPDAVISTDTSCPVDESIDFDAVRERLINSTDSPRMKRILSHFGRIKDPAFRRYPEVPISTFIEV